MQTIYQASGEIELCRAGRVVIEFANLEDYLLRFQRDARLEILTLRLLYTRKGCNEALGSRAAFYSQQYICSLIPRGTNQNRIRVPRGTTVRSAYFIFRDGSAASNSMPTHAGAKPPRAAMTGTPRT